MQFKNNVCRLWGHTLFKYWDSVLLSEEAEEDTGGYRGADFAGFELSDIGFASFLSIIF